MSVKPKKIANMTLAATTAQVVYTVPTGSQAIITYVSAACSKSSTASCAFMVSAGGVVHVPNVEVKPGGKWAESMSMVLNAGDTISVQASIANVLGINISGVEVTG